MLICALALSSAIPAQQAAIASPGPKLETNRWVVRGSVPIENATARLYCFVPATRFAYRRAMRTLSSLQYAAGNKVACIAVLPTKRARDLLKLGYGKTPSKCHVVVDQKGQTREAYEGLFDTDASGVPTVIIDAKGVLLWRGPLSLDQRYLIEDVQLSLLSPEQGRALSELEALSAVARRSRSWQNPLRLAATLSHKLPAHWLPLAVQLEAIPHGKPQAAQREVWLRATKRLKGRPEYLARVLGKVIVRNAALALDPEFAEAFGTVLGADAKSELVTRACFEFSAARGEDKAAMTWAFRWLEAIKSDPMQLKLLARHLSRPGKAERFADVSLLAYDLALRATPMDGDLLYAKFDLLICQRGDSGGADRVGRKIVEVYKGDIRFLNSFAWRLLTELPYKKSLAALALHAGQQMAKIEGWRAYWRVDTLALAMFANGRLDEAVALQRDAVASCDTSSSGRYEQRLARYEQALAAQPSKPGK